MSKPGHILQVKISYVQIRAYSPIKLHMSKSGHIFPIKIHMSISGHIFPIKISCVQIRTHSPNKSVVCPNPDMLKISYVQTSKVKGHFPHKRHSSHSQNSNYVGSDSVHGYVGGSCDLDQNLKIKIPNQIRNGNSKCRTTLSLIPPHVDT